MGYEAAPCAGQAASTRCNTSKGHCQQKPYFNVIKLYTPHRNTTHDMTEKSSKNPNVDRWDERQKSKDAQELRDKYKDGSHTENVNTPADEEAFHDQKTSKDKDIQSSEAPILNRKAKNEQHVEVKNKSSLDEKEG